MQIEEEWVQASTCVCVRKNAEYTAKRRSVCHARRRLGRLRADRFLAVAEVSSGKSHEMTSLLQGDPFMALRNNLRLVLRCHS
jgi:hypothetical protein